MIKHILLIHQAFVGPGQAGGTRHYEFARILVPTGHYRFTIIASTLSYLTGQRSNEDNNVELESGIQVLRAYTPAISHRNFFWRVMAFLSFMLTSVWTARRAQHIDLVMGTSPPMFQAISAWLVALVRQRPFLLEVRDLWPEFAIDMGVLKNPILISLSRGLEKFLYSRADHILVNSPAYREYMLKRGIPEYKVSLISNGVDPDLFHPDNDGHTIRDRWNLGDKFIVTYAGALGMANDINVILQAANRLCDRKDIHFLIAGDGKERLALEATVQKQNLTNITFIGALPKSEMPNVLAASDVCTATLLNIPMFRTTYPNKVFDYMAAGRPTILGIDGVIREVIDAAKGGIFVEPGNDEALANAIIALCDDRAKAHDMGKAARAYVERHFNRHEQAKDFALLIDRLTSRS